MEIRTEINGYFKENGLKLKHYIAGEPTKRKVVLPSPMPLLLRN